MKNIHVLKTIINVGQFFPNDLREAHRFQGVLL